MMDMMFWPFIIVVLIGILTWFIVRAIQQGDKNEIIYSPQEVTQKIRKGFYLSNWGIDFLVGSILSFAIAFCDVHIVFKFIAPIGSIIIGLVLFLVGRIQVGLMTRYLNFCNRERTEFEEWVLQAMQGVEESAMRRQGINAITKMTPGVSDEMLLAIKSRDIIRGYTGIGKVYIGKNVFKNHWPIVVEIMMILISIIITIKR